MRQLVIALALLSLVAAPAFASKRMKRGMLSRVGRPWSF